MSGTGINFCSREDLKNEENVQYYQMLGTLEQDYKSGDHPVNEYESSKFETREKPNQEY